MSYECIFDSAEIYNTDKVEYYCLKNFRKSHSYSQGREEVFLEGNYFIITPDEFLWHFISEQLTQYELLLQEVPDLKLLFLNISHYISDTPIQTLKEFVEQINKKDYDHKFAYFEDAVKMYLGEDLDKTNIYNYSSFNFVVENAYTIFDLRHMIDPKTFARKRIKKPYYLNSYKFVYENQTYTVYDHAPWSGLENISASWQKDGMILIRKRFHNFLKEDESLPKKIYIDRSDANSKWTKSKTFPQRIFKKEYIVKDYFKKHGFVPIVMSKYGYIDQLNFYFNATHIAGLCGTGLLGGFVAKNDTILIEVYTNKGYNFSYSYLTEISPIDVISIELRNGDGELNRDLYNILDKYKGAGFFGI